MKTLYIVILWTSGVSPLKDFKGSRDERNENGREREDEQEPANERQQNPQKQKSRNRFDFGIR